MRGANFWIGNEYLAELTNPANASRLFSFFWQKSSKITNRYRLLILMTLATGAPDYVVYDNFKVGPASDKYRLSLGAKVRTKQSFPENR